MNWRVHGAAAHSHLRRRASRSRLTPPSARRSRRLGMSDVHRPLRECRAGSAAHAYPSHLIEEGAEGSLRLVARARHHVLHPQLASSIPADQATLPHCQEINRIPATFRHKPALRHLCSLSQLVPNSNRPIPSRRLDAHQALALHNRHSTVLSEADSTTGGFDAERRLYTTASPFHRPQACGRATRDPHDA